jgi:2-oxo-3-hexenedioate decarboxylase
MDATDLAAELIDLHDRPRLVPPFSARYPGLTADSGYAAARKLHAHRLAQGWKAAGRKIGFTNRTIWPRYGVYEPMWGTVYDKTLIFSQNNSATVSLSNLVQPRIEPEICFRMTARPPATRDPQALLGCIEWIAHSVEIVQCHHPEWKVTIADGTADNGLHGRLILGTPVAVERISGLAAALPFLKVDLLKNQEKKDQGIGSNVLGSPLLALSFLMELLEKHPDAPPLEAGEIVSTGTLTDAHPVAPGERWSTDFHGFAVRGMEIEFV